MLLRLAGRVALYHDDAEVVPSVGVVALVVHAGQRRSVDQDASVVAPEVDDSPTGKVRILDGEVKVVHVGADVDGVIGRRRLDVVNRQLDVVLVRVNLDGALYVCISGDLKVFDRNIHIACVNPYRAIGAGLKLVPVAVKCYALPDKHHLG